MPRVCPQCALHLWRCVRTYVRTYIAANCVQTKCFALTQKAELSVVNIIQRYSHVRRERLYRGIVRGHYIVTSLHTMHEVVACVLSIGYLLSAVLD